MSDQDPKAKSLANLKPWQPGESGNPSGRPALPEDIKEARKLNAVELERTLNKIIWMKKGEIKTLISDPDTPAFESLIASIVVKGISGGDHMRAEWVVSRLVGKLKEHYEHTGSNGQPLFQTLVELVKSLEPGAKTDPSHETQG